MFWSSLLWRMFCHYYRGRKGSAQNSGSGKIFVSSLVLNTLNYNNLVLKIKLCFSLWALRCHRSGKFILLHLASVLFCCCCFIPETSQKIVIWLHRHVVDKRPSSTAYRCRSRVTSCKAFLEVSPWAAMWHIFSGQAKGLLCIQCIFPT